MGKKYRFWVIRCCSTSSILRDKNTGVKEFPRDRRRDRSPDDAMKTTRNLPTEEMRSRRRSPWRTTKVLFGKKLAIVPILRAGLGMVDSMIGS